MPKGKHDKLYNELSKTRRFTPVYKWIKISVIILSLYNALLKTVNKERHTMQEVTIKKKEIMKTTISHNIILFVWILRFSHNGIKGNLIEFPINNDIAYRFNEVTNYHDIRIQSQIPFYHIAMVQRKTAILFKIKGYASC